MANENNYNINLFKPLTKHGRANTRLIITLVIIWIVGVFGFQTLLLIFNKPTPEKNYATFETLWPSVVDDPASAPEAKKEFARILLSVLGKNVVLKKDHKGILQETFSWTIFDLLPPEKKELLRGDIELNKAELMNLTASILNLQSTGFDKIYRDLLTTSFVPVTSDQLTGANKEALPAIMELYLVHNRSFLTDTKLFGFPFHYWYSSQALLALFVLLCLTYAILIERIHKKHNFVEE